MRFTTYNIASGEIKSNYDVPSDTAQNQYAKGDAIISGHFSGETHYVNHDERFAYFREDFEITSSDLEVTSGDSFIVEMPENCYIRIDNGEPEFNAGGIVSFTALKLGFMSFELVGQYKSKVHNVRVVSVDLSKIEANRLINDKFETSLMGGFEYLGHTFDSDERSMQMITAAATIAATNSLPADFQWKTRNNTYVTMGNEVFTAFNEARFAFVNDLFNLKEQQKADLIPLGLLTHIQTFKDTL